MPDRVDGQSTFGSTQVEDCRVRVITKAGSASALVLVDTAGVEQYLWVDNTGIVRVGTQANFETAPNTAGTIVGTQL